MHFHLDFINCPIIVFVRYQEPTEEESSDDNYQTANDQSFETEQNGEENQGGDRTH